MNAPQFVKNHITKQKEIVVQDINNNLYLISNKGKIIWDLTKPDGTPRKLMDVTKLSGLGWKYTISLKKGLEMVYQEYQSRQ